MDAFEHWELDEQLRHVARVLGPECLEQRRRTQHQTRPDDDASWTDWLALGVGFCALAVGGVLCAGEIWGRQANSWKFGLAVALMGLAALAIGLWQPSAKCHRLDDLGRSSHGGAQGPGLPLVKQIPQCGG